MPVFGAKTLFTVVGKQSGTSKRCVVARVEVGRAYASGTSNYACRAGNVWEVKLPLKVKRMMHLPLEEGDHLPASG
jgi:hypothetical protein